MHDAPNHNGHTHRQIIREIPYEQNYSYKCLRVDPLAMSNGTTRRQTPILVIFPYRLARLIAFIII